jgi:hypothetical protein
MNIKPLIRLWNSTGLGLIISYPSGVLYTNQTGGHACMQSQEEGVFVPLYDESVQQENMLYDYFFGPKWEGWCDDHIDIETADYIDQVLDLSKTTRFLKVDRTKLHLSHEAWVFVQIADQPEEPPITHNMENRIGITQSGRTWKDSDYSHLPIEGWLYSIYGFGPSVGILTWGNSD